MQIKAKVGGNTTSGEFRALAIFFDALAQNKASEFDSEPKVVGSAVAVAPTNEQASQAQPKVEAQQAQVQQTTRRRRTKAEIEADEAAKKQAEINEALDKDGAAEAEAKNQETAVAAETIDISTGEITTTPVEEFEKVANEPAVTNGKTYSEAEVQTLASVVARTKGAGIVKDKIAELGKARIAELDQNQLNLLGAFLEGQK